MVSLMANIGMIGMGYPMTPQILRDTFEKCDNYTCALDHLANHTITAVAYFIVAGQTEGAVISRDRSGPANIKYLNDSANTWYLYQTNEDHFDG